MAVVGLTDDIQDGGARQTLTQSKTKLAPDEKHLNGSESEEEKNNTKGTESAVRRRRRMIEYISSLQSLPAPRMPASPVRNVQRNNNDGSVMSGVGAIASLGSNSARESIRQQQREERNREYNNHLARTKLAEDLARNRRLAGHGFSAQPSPVERKSAKQQRELEEERNREYNEFLKSKWPELAGAGRELWSSPARTGRESRSSPAGASQPVGMVTRSRSADALKRDGQAEFYPDEVEYRPEYGGVRKSGEQWEYPAGEEAARRGRIGWMTPTSQSPVVVGPDYAQLLTSRRLLESNYRRQNDRFVEPLGVERILFWWQR